MQRVAPRSTAANLLLLNLLGKMWVNSEKVIWKMWHGIERVIFKMCKEHIKVIWKMCVNVL